MLRRLAPPARPAALCAARRDRRRRHLASIALALVSWSAATERMRGTGLVVGLIGTLLLLTDLMWLSGALPVAHAGVERHDDRRAAPTVPVSGELFPLS